DSVLATLLLPRPRSVGVWQPTPIKHRTVQAPNSASRFPRLFLAIAPLLGLRAHARRGPRGRRKMLLWLGNRSRAISCQAFVRTLKGGTFSKARDSCKGKKGPSVQGKSLACHFCLVKNSDLDLKRDSSAGKGFTPTEMRGEMQHFLAISVNQTSCRASESATE